MEIVSVDQEKDSAVVEVNLDIIKTAEEAQIEASGELLANLRRMVNEPSFSDVVFVCNDGKRVQGSRILLSGMSDVLRSMFMNGMAESNLSEIPLPEISSPVLLSVFEYLYTGTLLHYIPQTWKIACEVIIASRFFLLPKLEKITRKFMHDQTISVAEDLPKVASLLTEAVRFKPLREEPDVNLRELVAILSSNWSDCIFLECLSVDAFDYLLGKSKSNCKDDYKLSFEEYLRFKQVIRWCFYQSDCHGPPTADELVDYMLPPEKRALSLCSDSYNGVKVETPMEDGARLSQWNSLLQDGGKELRQTAFRLMSNIDCRRIHPLLLAKLVEPFKIISADEILNSLWFHAVRRPMIFKRLECSWEHGESYSTLEQGFKIQRTGRSIGLAVATEAMSRSHGVYQWRFVLEERCSSFGELGYIYYTGGGRTEKPELDGERLSDQHRARVLRFQGSSFAVNWEGAGGRVDWKGMGSDNGTVIALFNYNASKHNCSLSLNGHDHGEIWNDLPSATYYPAVCLGNSTNGRVSIELVSGFDII